jgi:serine/threonine protein phosphatase 1
MAILSITDSEPTAAPVVAYPPAPEDRVLYVIGDIHGRRDLLERVFEAIDRDKARARDRRRDLERSPDGAGRTPSVLAEAGEVGSTEPDFGRAPGAETQSPRSSSFIGPDLTVNGLIEARGDVRIDGHVCGDVCANRIVVGQGASIEGSLIAREVVIGGTIRGSVRGDSLTLGQTSCVEADVSHNSLIVEKGCYFEGKSRRVDHLLRASDLVGIRQSSDALEIYLGDYIDRGDDSRGVVDALIERSEHAETIFLRGNHEQFLLDFLVGRFDLSTWKQLGAIPTLQSYGVQTGQPSFLASQDSQRQALDEALAGSHARFFADTVPYFVAGPYLFVHAGLRPGIPLEQQQPADLMGIRRQFLEFEGDLGRIVVHGHTPVPNPEFKHNRINLDTGAYSTGRLTCLRIDRHGPELLEA